MSDLNFWSEIFKTYGIGAIFGFFFMQIFKGVLKHYMATIDAKDRHIKEIIDAKDQHIQTISQSNLTALQDNTQAIHKLSESHLEVSHTMRNICDGFDRNSAQNREEHGEILKFCHRKLHSQ